MYRSFQSINLGGAAGRATIGVVLARAGASWEPHTRQLTETISRALVWRNTNVAFVVVTVRPQAFGRAQVARARQVAHCPETRPETTDVTFAR
jgi:hypothetical protein